jgi:hypothetical protein
MRLVHTSLGKKLALQRVDGSPESADRLPFGVLDELRGQNCTEKLIAAAILPVVGVPPHYRFASNCWKPIRDPFLRRRLYPLLRRLYGFARTAVAQWSSSRD